MRNENRGEYTKNTHCETNNLVTNEECENIVKLSSYLKEQLKFTSFLGVEGGGHNSPLKSPTFICNDKNQCFFNAKF